MVTKLNNNAARMQRHKRVRGKISGTALCPRLNVFRSHRHLNAQLINDADGEPLDSVSTVEKEFSEYGGNKDAARKVGELLAKRAKEKNITDVVFDRGGYLYHGRVASLAEGAREGGLNF